VTPFGAQTASRFNATTDNLFQTPREISEIAAPREESLQQWQLQQTQRLEGMEDQVSSLTEKGWFNYYLTRKSLASSLKLFI
jgi:hypothetical protein